MTSLKVDEEYSQNVSKGSVLDVVKVCRTEGQWIDQTSVQLDFLCPPYNHDNEFEIVEEEEVKNRFAVGDKVISGKDASQSPEGTLGYVSVNDNTVMGGLYPYRVECGDKETAKVFSFKEDELELLSVGGKEKIQQLKEEAHIIFDALVDKDYPFNRDDITPQDIAGVSKAEYTGGSSSYYKVDVANPTTSDAPYQAECSDIIEALGLDFFEGNILKALWRRGAARKTGKMKKGYDSEGKYDAEKIKWFADRIAARYNS